MPRRGGGSSDLKLPRRLRPMPSRFRSFFGTLPTQFLWAYNDAVALGRSIILRLLLVDLTLLLDAPHLREHTAHPKDGVANTPQLRGLAVERRDALMLQGRVGLLLVSPDVPQWRAERLRWLHRPRM